MKRILLGLFLSTTLQAHGNSIWVEQNNLVGEIGGWRTYAKEKVQEQPLPQGATYSLNQAIERSLSQQLDWTNYLPGSESIQNFYLLTPAQRSALQQRYTIIYETTKSYYELVALKEKSRYMADVVGAVQAASELTNRMQKVGNINQLGQLKQQKELLKTQLEMQSLQTKTKEAAERFIQRMNFDQRNLKLDVDNRLPTPPKDARKLTDKERRAIDLGDINSPATVQVRSNARIAYENYLERFQKVKTYQTELLPNQKKISEEKLLRYNAMLIDVFHLLEDAEDQRKTVMQYIDANAAFLIQSARLEKALIDAQMDFSNINAR
jgi:methyl coenzyme M reductase subunit D